jgi:hypothetical protein
MKLNLDTSNGRGVAYTGLFVGVGVSVAGNVAHAYVPPSGAPVGWGPPGGLVLSAAVWPLVLFLAVEAMLQVPWPRTWYYVVARWGGLSVVAFVAGFISYQHLSDLLTFWGEDGLTTDVGPIVLNATDLGPFAVDGLMVMCAGALLALRDCQPVVEPSTIEDLSRLTTAAVNSVNPPLNDAVADELTTGRRQLATEITFDGRPVVVSDTNGARPVGANARLVMDALPGTVSDLARRTGVKRTTVDYALKRTLADQVRQDGDVWRQTS